MIMKERIDTFCSEFGLDVPIMLAPMAGACPPDLSVAVANAGGMGACGALLMDPKAIAGWVDAFRARSNRSVQLNLWIPDPEPQRDLEAEASLREFLGKWGPPVPEDAANAKLMDFDAQCEALLIAKPTVISSIMGLFPADFVSRMKDNGTKWFATVTTEQEAKLAEDAGADVIVAQGSEAGGHRGAFNAADAERKAVGLFSLLPAVVDAVDVPVVATGGIADGRGIAAALMLGASAVQIGTGFLRCPEAQIASAWADGLGTVAPEDTMVTRAFSGRSGRSIATDYALAMSDKNAPSPAPYPIQRALTQEMRSQAAKDNDLQKMQAWAGQSARLAKPVNADELLKYLWIDAAHLAGLN